MFEKKRTITCLLLIIFMSGCAHNYDSRFSYTCYPTQVISDQIVEIQSDPHVEYSIRETGRSVLSGTTMKIQIEMDKQELRDLIPVRIIKLMNGYYKESYEPTESSETKTSKYTMLGIQLYDPATPENKMFRTYNTDNFSSETRINKYAKNPNRHNRRESMFMTINETTNTLNKAGLHSPWDGEIQFSKYSSNWYQSDDFDASKGEWRIFVLKEFHAKPSAATATRSIKLTTLDDEALKQYVRDYQKKYKLFAVKKGAYKQTFHRVDPKLEMRKEIFIFYPFLKIKPVFAEQTLELMCTINAQGLSFKKTAESLGIKPKYAYLIPQFVDKKRVGFLFDKKNATLKLDPWKDKENKEYMIYLDYYDATRLFAEIKRIESIGYGYVKLHANVKGVSIFVDGKKIGDITDTKKPFVAKIEEGNRIITAKKHLFGSRSIKVKVEKNDAFAYAFELQPAGNMAELKGSGKIIQSVGTLVILSSRNDLAVYIEGVKRIPPFKLPEMSSGQFKVLIKGPGIEKTIQVTVEPDKINTYNLDEIIQ